MGLDYLYEEENAYQLKLVDSYKRTQNTIKVLKESIETMEISENKTIDSSYRILLTNLIKDYKQILAMLEG